MREAASGCFVAAAAVVVVSGARRPGVDGPSTCFLSRFSSPGAVALTSGTPRFAAVEGAGGSVDNCEAEVVLLLPVSEPGTGLVGGASFRSRFAPNNGCRSSSRRTLWNTKSVNRRRLESWPCGVWKSEHHHRQQLHQPFFFLQTCTREKRHLHSVSMGSSSRRLLMRMCSGGRAIFRIFN